MEQYRFALLIFLNVALVTTYAATSESVLQEVVTKLGLGNEYVKSPCRLMPYVELSSLLLINELRMRLQRDPVNPRTIDDATVKHAQQIYYEVGLHGMMYAGCLLTRNLGEGKARDVLKQWVSGYSNVNRRNTVLANFDVSINEGKQSKSDRECLRRIINSLKQQRIDTDSDSLVPSELVVIQNKLNGRKFTSAQLKAATEAVAATCLLTTPSLSDDEKTEVGMILIKAANFFHLLEGGVIRVVIGDNANTELINTLLRGILRSKYLSRDEQMSRVMLVIDGESVARNACSSSVDDCIENIQGHRVM